MDPIICDEKHKNINETLFRHERRMNDHGQRIDRVEMTSTRHDERMLGLISQLEGLNKTLKWFIGLMTGAFVSFFFYVVQSNILGG